MTESKLGRRAVLQRGAQMAMAGSGLSVLSHVTQAQTGEAWPVRPVKIVVPFPAGGSTDAFARLLARKLGESLSQPFTVDNRSGANGNLGAAAVASAAADGYTLLLSTTGPLSINRLMYPTTPFNPLSDFTPISLLADVALLLAAHPSFPARTFAQLVAYVKTKPGEVTYSTAGNGSMGHLAAELVQRATGTRMTHVPYRGSALALSDLLAGVVNLSFDLVPTYLQQIEAGKVKALAVLGPERTPVLPNVPTLRDVGIKTHATGWYGLVGPKGTPANVVAKTNKIVNDFLASTEGKAQLQVLGMRPIGGKPEDLARFMAAETEKWRPIVASLAPTMQ